MRTEKLESEQIAAVLALASAAEAADGVAPLSEQTLLTLRNSAGGATHLLAVDNGRVLGYAQVTPGAGDEPPSGEVVVAPDARGDGVGRGLVRAALDSAPGLAIWAHGEHPGALALARSLDLVESRVLYKMCSPLAPGLPAAKFPDDVRVRAFVPGVDEDAWLRVNARAFADHPEQGHWTRADVEDREAEPWFDPAGFLLAERGGELVGFHWTKRHSPEVGEVYVLGVDPSAQRLRLGTALTLAGLRHLVDNGVTEAILYVDKSNPRAVGLYTGLSFEVCATDVMYAR